MLIALVALIGGCTTYYATLLLAFLHFPGLDGIYLALILIPLMMPVGAAASGYLAFRLTKQRQGGGGVRRAEARMALGDEAASAGATFATRGENKLCRPWRGFRDFFVGRVTQG